MLFQIISILICLLAMTTANSPKIQFSLMEELPSGHLVGSIANKSVQHLNYTVSELSYRFLTQSEAQSLFTINDNSGDIFTSVVIDREHICGYDTVCVKSFDVAVKSKDLQYVQIISVEILIQDKNDNSPMFVTESNIIAIPEDSSVNSLFKLETATDKDTGANNSVQAYELVMNDDSKDFFKLNITINRDSTFNLRLVLLRSLNREAKDSYSLVLVAKDGGNPPKTGTQKIIINVTDANDNAPEFTQKIYNVTIKENTAPMETILTVSASDKDLNENAKVSYRISEYNLNKDRLGDTFVMISETGELKVKSDFTALAGQVVRFFIEAYDHGVNPLYSQAEVVVNIEDDSNNAPKVTISFITAGNKGFVDIPENSMNNSFVAYVDVVDSDKGDNGVVDCSVSNSHFSIVKISKGFKVVVNSILDREVLSTYNLTVTCSDKGTPVLSESASFLLHVTDINDNKPVFSPNNYTARLPEHNKGNEMILQVTARDADSGSNALFTFLPNEDARGRFVVDSSTGVVYANAIFDRENEPVILFHVLAVDKGNPSLTGTAIIVLTIADVNDNAPMFIQSSYELKIKENQGTGTDVYTFKATDLDEGSNSVFDFKIDSQNSEIVPFVLLQDGLLKTNKQLDREERSRYDFVAIVTDRGDNHLSTRALVSVIVEDENDNSPVITFPRPSNNSVEVEYPDYASEYITTVEAYDIDAGRNKDLVFSIAAGNELGIFKLDSKTGNLCFNSKVDIGSDVMIGLDISVKDQGLVPLETMKTLFVDLKYTNATFLKSTLDSVQSKNIIITVVVVVVTLVISGTIIGVILFLRTADKRRKATEKVANNSSSSLSSDFGFTAQNPNHTILSIDTLSSVSASGEGQDLIKKKEVSFQDSYEYHQRKQTASFTTGSDKPSKSSLRVNPQHFSPHLVPQVPESQQTREPVPPSQLDTLELQYQASSQLSTLKLQQLMLQSRAKQWVEQQQTFGTTRTTSQHDDHHSEGSAETIASDSGRGCSEEDDVFSTPSADDPKLFEISSPESQRSKDCTTGQRQNRPLEAPGYTALCFKEPWTRKPHLKSHLAPISHSQISLNRNLNVRHSVQSDSTYSIYKDSNNGFSWGSCLHGQDFTGDSALHSFFDKTPVNYANAYRDDDDMCSTTTSGSYTINPEIDFL